MVNHLIWSISESVITAAASEDRPYQYSHLVFPLTKSKAAFLFPSVNARLPAPQPVCCLSLIRERFSEQRLLSGKYPACQIPLLVFDLSSTDPDCSGGRSGSSQRKRTRLCSQPKAQLGLFHWVFEYERVNTAIAHGCVCPSGMIRLNRFRLCLSH